MTREIVCNTGPLIALAIVNHLQILQSLFQRVLIPEAVHKEILQGGASSAGLSAYGEVDWVDGRPLTSPLDPLLGSVLDFGEASVIQLARQLGVKTVLLDERKARRVARNVYGLQVIGTARVLVEARRECLLRSVKRIILQMREGGYWIHEDIVKFALREAGKD
jgi:predicted nucleic acid-binding protein